MEVKEVQQFVKIQQMYIQDCAFYCTYMLLGKVKMYQILNSGE